MDCKDCSFKEDITENKNNIEIIRAELASQDKQTAIFKTEIRIQYKTILETIINQGKTTKENTDRLIELERKEILNDYKTNKSVSFIEKITPSKILAIAISVLTILVAVNQLFLE